MALAGALSAAAARAADVSVCFTPEQSCVGRVVAAIDEAREEALVQAYVFTSRPVMDALVRAQRRGLRVGVIADGSDIGRTCHYLRRLIGGGVPVWIDHPKGIAHGKSIELDRREVIAGSYNWTWSAEHVNVEDLLVIRDPGVAAAFAAHWRARQAVSAPTSCPAE